MKTKTFYKGRSTGRTIGERITLARINKAMDRATLSRLTFIEYSRLYNIEQGIDKPTGDEYHTIFKVIGSTSATHVWRKYSDRKGASI